MNYFAFSLSDILNFDKAVANNMSAGEKLENILTTAVGGFILVFVVLATIWGLLELFSLIFAKKPAKASKPEEKAEPAPVVVPVVEETADETELIAVITAAVTAYRSSEESNSGSFRVVSFRRK